MKILSRQFFITGTIIFYFTSINIILTLPEPIVKSAERIDHSWYETKTEKPQQKLEELRIDRNYGEFQNLVRETTDPKTITKTFETKSYSTDNWLSYLTSKTFASTKPDIKAALFDSFIDHLAKNEFSAEKINKSLQYLDKIIDTFSEAQKQKAYESVTEKARALRQGKHNEKNNDRWIGSPQDLNNFYTLLSTAIKLGNEKNRAISKDQYDYVAKNIRIALNAENLARLPKDRQAFIITTLKENLPSLIEKLLSDPSINKDAAQSLFISMMKNFDAALNGEMNTATVQIATALIPTITKIIDKARGNKNIKALVEAWDKEFASMKKKEPLQGKSFEEYIILLSGDKLPSTLSKLILSYKAYSDGEHSLAFYEELLAEPDITFDFATEALQFLIEEAKNSMGTKQQALVKIIQDQLNSDKFKATGIIESPENIAHYIKTIGQLFNNFVKVEGTLPAQGSKKLLLNNLQQVLTQPKYQKALMSEPQSAATTFLATNFLLQNKAVIPENAATIVTNLIAANKMQPSEFKSFQDTIKSNNTLRTFLSQLWTTTTTSSNTISEQQKRNLAKALATIDPSIEKTKTYQEIIATEKKQPTTDVQQKTDADKAKADRAIEEAAMKEAEDKFTAAQLAKIDNALKNPTNIKTLTSDELLAALTRPNIIAATDPALIASNASLITAIIDRYNSINNPTKLLTEKYDLFTEAVKKSLDSTLDNTAKINPDQVTNLLDLLKKFAASIPPFEVNTITPLLKKLIANQTLTIANKIEILRSVQFSKELLTDKVFVQDLFGPLYKAEMIDVAGFKELGKLATEFKGQFAEQYMQLIIEFIKKNIGQLETNQISSLIDSAISLGQEESIFKELTSMAMTQPDINSFIEKLPQTITRPAVIDQLLERANKDQISSEDSLKIITVALNNNGTLLKSLNALMRLDIEFPKNIINLIKSRFARSGMFNEEEFFKIYSNQLKNLSAAKINNLDMIMTAAGNQKILVEAIKNLAIQEKWSLEQVMTRFDTIPEAQAQILVEIIPTMEIKGVDSINQLLNTLQVLKNRVASPNAKAALTDRQLFIINKLSAQEFERMSEDNVNNINTRISELMPEVSQLKDIKAAFDISVATLGRIITATKMRLEELEYQKKHPWLYSLQNTFWSFLAKSFDYSKLDKTANKATLLRYADEVNNYITLASKEFADPNPTVQNKEEKMFTEILNNIDLLKKKLSA